MARKAVVMVDAVESLTIKEAFDEFIAEKITQGIAPKTLRNYEQSFQYFMELELDENEEFLIGELFKPYILQWVGAMQKRKMKVVTINSYLRVMRVFLYWCMDSERLYIEPAYKISLVKGEETLPKVFSDEDVEKLIQKPTHAKDYVEWRSWAILNMVAATGIRASTVCGLRMEDINFTTGEIYLRHLKNKKVQIMPMSEALEMVLKAYVKASRSRATPKEFLFISSTTGEQLTYNALAHSIARYCEERGASLKNIHAMRHYFGTAYARISGDTERLRRLLGHSTYSTTKRYMNLVDADLRKEFDERNPLDRAKAKRARTKRVEME